MQGLADAKDQSPPVPSALAAHSSRRDGRAQRRMKRRRPKP